MRFFSHYGNGEGKLAFNPVQTCILSVISQIFTTKLNINAQTQTNTDLPCSLI